MARIKVILEPGETQLDVDNAMEKALAFHTNGDVHSEQSFDDPAMDHVAQRMRDAHSRMYAEMIREISDVLDEEYSEDGNS